MGEISRDSKNIHDGVFLFFFSPPWNFSDETEIREAYVPSAYVHFVVRWRCRWEVCRGWMKASSSRGHVPLSILCFSEVFEHPVALPTDTVGGEGNCREMKLAD